MYRQYNVIFKFLQNILKRPRQNGWFIDCFGTGAEMYYFHLTVLGIGEKN